MGVQCTMSCSAWVTVFDEAAGTGNSLDDEHSAIRHLDLSSVGVKCPSEFYTGPGGPSSPPSDMYHHPSYDAAHSPSSPPSVSDMYPQPSYDAAHSPSSPPSGDWNYP